MSSEKPGDLEYQLILPDTPIGPIVETTHFKDIEKDLLLVLRIEGRLEYSAINLKELHPKRALAGVVESLLDLYVAFFSETEPVTVQDVTAVIVGGVFRQNQLTREQIYVWEEHGMMYDETRKALHRLGVTHVVISGEEAQPDVFFQTKEGSVSAGGVVRWSGRTKGSNKNYAPLSLVDYELKRRNAF